MTPKENLTPYGILVLGFACIGGLLFGYHTAVISGALIFFDSLFHLTPFDEGMVVSIMLLGGLLGALAAGFLADRVGRKKAMLFAAFLFIIGSLLIALSDSYGQVLAGRALSGFAIGVVTVVAPLYLAEIAPPHYRGRCVAALQLSLALGILLAYIVAFIFSQEQKWQMLFFFGAVISLIQLVALCFIPESPSWALSHGKETIAIQALSRLRKDRHWEKEIQQMHKHTEQKGQWKDFLKPHIPYILFVGFTLSAFQQLTGVNAIIYYTPKIFQSAGITSIKGSFLATLTIGVINCLATVFSLWMLDRIGRRALLLIGSMGMALSLGLICYGFFLHSSAIPTLAMISLICFVCCFALGLGPITWVLLAEIFPLKIRGNAMACAMALNWLANYAVSFFFPNMIAAWGGGWSFAVFIVICFICFYFVYRCISETKGKSLEEIEELVQTGKF